MFLNELSGMAFFYFRPEKNDYLTLSDLFRKVLEKNFRAMDIEYIPEGPVEILKSEARTEMEKIREKLLSLESYIPDDGKYLIYAGYVINRGRRGVSAVTKFLELTHSVHKDISKLLNIREMSGEKRSVSILFPSCFTLFSVKQAIDAIFGLNPDVRYDFISYSTDEHYKSLDMIYRPEVFRALDEELDERFKRKGCEYTLAKSMMLSMMPGKLVYRFDLGSPEYYEVDLDSEMENFNLSSPLILSLRWVDIDSFTLKLREIRN